MANFNRREVPTQGLREAFERSGMTKGELARRMGWVKPNIDRVNRALGYRPDSNSHEPGVREQNRESTSYGLAQRLADAMGIDQTDIEGM